VLVSNVSGPRLASLLTEVATQTWSLQPSFVQATAAAAGIRSAYAEPGKLGVDRWLAMIAAHDMVHGAVCVVSIGTAMTIDGLDAGGVHLGGLITPGPQLMVHSLLGGTSDIAARAGAVQPTDALFATDTATAIHNGARHALAALIARASQRIAEQVNAQPILMLTGGATPLIETLVPLGRRVVPDLVLRGLVVLAERG
jgi:type III pantothenate kinase